MQQSGSNQSSDSGKEESVGSNISFESSLEGIGNDDLSIDSYNDTTTDEVTSAIVDTHKLVVDDTVDHDAVRTSSDHPTEINATEDANENTTVQQSPVNVTSSSTNVNNNNLLSASFNDSIEIESTLMPSDQKDEDEAKEVNNNQDDLDKQTSAGFIPMVVLQPDKSLDLSKDVTVANEVDDTPLTMDDYTPTADGSDKSLLANHDEENISDPQDVTEKGKVSTSAYENHTEVESIDDESKKWLYPESEKPLLQRRNTDKRSNSNISAMAKKYALQMKPTSTGIHYQDTSNEYTTLLYNDGRPNYGDVSNQQYNGGQSTTLPLQSLFTSPSPPSKQQTDYIIPKETTIPTNKKNQQESCNFAKCLSNVTRESIISTLVGGSIFVLFHIVFCLAQASAIPRPHSNRPILGPMVRAGALGPIIVGPVYVYLMNLPALYPTIDAFPIPFLAQQAIIVDDMLHEVGLEDDDDIFFTTVFVLSGLSLILSGLMIFLATRIKLANLGAYLPFPVMCGFFTSVGLLGWTFAFSVDTSGNTVAGFIQGSGTELGGDVELNGWEFRKACLIHHIPTVIMGVFINYIAQKNRTVVPILCIATMGLAYAIMFITNTSIDEARDRGWFWSDEDFRSDNTYFVSSNEYEMGLKGYLPPLPFGVLNGVMNGKVYVPAVIKGLPIVFAYAAIYLIRCSLHAPALKKNAVFVRKYIEEQEAEKREKQLKVRPARVRCSSDDQEQGIVTNTTAAKIPISVPDILNLYGKVLCVSGLAGGSACIPSLGAAGTLSKLGATGKAPQYASMAMLLVFYFNKFELVSHIPKITFSSLIIVSSMDLMNNWFLTSYKRHADKKEWIVVPILVVFTFTVGILYAVALGIGISTFIFVGTFYASGIVKFIGNGLVVHSTVERSARDGEWLDRHGDMIQILVLQNYLFFGNANSLLHYVNTMFEELPSEKDLEFPLPPFPKYSIFDLTLVTGMDTSAVDVFGEIITVCKNNNCQVYISGITPHLKSVLSFGGVKPSLCPGLRFVPDLEAALGKAEDGLLKFVYKVEDQERARMKIRRMSVDDDGFAYALQQIDSQHGTDAATELEELRSLTQVIELKEGESLYHDSHGNLKDERERGLFFIEAGLMKVERDPSLTLTRGSKASLKRKGMGTIYATPRITKSNSISDLHVRTPTIGRESEMLKNTSRVRASTKNVRLARFGPGWIVGAQESCSQLMIPGLYSAVTNCRLHHLPYRAIEELEHENPFLVLKLFKLLSRISARRQESTIQQLATFHSIMTSLAPTKPVSRVTMAAIQNALKSEV